jgi:hypothetical protein
LVSVVMAMPAGAAENRHGRGVMQLRFTQTKITSN